MPILYVVASPIGNLNDLSPRVKEALEKADLIAAEDTRVAMKLLGHLGLSKPAVSCHRHNEESRSGVIIERMLAENLTVALTCDAGTPAVSDPGQLLVDAAWRAGIEVRPVCGPSATVTALSAAGFDAREFAFYGFLPRESKPLREKLAAIRETGIPVAVVYESPHRVVKLTEAICQTLPGCNLAVCCDLSKLYEKIYRGPCEAVLEQLRANPNVEKGEYCLVIDLSPLPPPEKKSDTLPADVVMLRAILDGADLAAAEETAREAGCPRNDIYRARLRIQALFEEEDD
ncbi:MAG: 16S rRNA (cytidine(1402)-2'-O)-methyltransferase [Clostridia bacterium]|nr:16S rRNA (cytidine(1402)-2'-O)-methyltransferase [Clostridia bacterium]